MSYGIILWGGTSEIKMILKARKKAIRYLCHKTKGASCRDLFKSLKILTAPSTYILEVVKKVKQNYSDFQNKSIKHEYFTRNKNHLMTSQAKLTSQKGLEFMGPKL